MTDKEKIDLCYEYIDIVSSLMELTGAGIAVASQLDRERVEVHNQICEAFGITREQCEDITNNLTEYISDRKGGDKLKKALESIK